MAATLIPVRDAEDVWGKTRTTLFDVLLDTAYPLSNGYVINAQDVGLKSILSARVEGGAQAAGAVLPVLDFGTPDGISRTFVALRLFLPTGGTSAPATLTAPVAAVTPGSITMGGTATGTLTAGADTVSIAANVAVPATGLTASMGSATSALTAGIGKEVGNGTDVSTVKVRVRFFGF